MCYETRGLYPVTTGLPWEEAFAQLEAAMGDIMREERENGKIMYYVIESVEYPGSTFACFPVGDKFYYEF